MIIKIGHKIAVSVSMEQILKQEKSVKELKLKVFGAFKYFENLNCFDKMELFSNLEKIN